MAPIVYGQCAWTGGSPVMTLPLKNEAGCLRNRSGLSCFFVAWVGLSLHLQLRYQVQIHNAKCLVGSRLINDDGPAAGRLRHKISVRDSQGAPVSKMDVERAEWV